MELVGLVAAVVAREVQSRSMPTIQEWNGFGQRVMGIFGVVVAGLVVWLLLHP